MGTLFDRLRAALSGRYTIERELGHGGMATVYLARDARHHRHVAVKVLRPELAATLGADRFFREIDVAAQLQHPNILPLLDSGTADGFYYYVMPYVEGESLRNRLALHGELPVPEAVRILSEVTDALACAHGHGVVHRDIKPDNILLSGRHALVMDFGVAKAVSDATGPHILTTVGVALGTPAYMAPEQAAADPHLDHRVDIYAVGVLGYELLTGRPPFTGRSAQEVMAAQVTRAPEPIERQRPGVPAALAQVLTQCLAKRPADRWQTAEELLVQLEPLTTPGGGTTWTVHGGPPGAGSPAWLKWAIAGAGLTVIAVVTLPLTRSRADEVTLGQVTPFTLEPGLEIEPAFSPDGKFVAYAAGPLSAMRIYVRQPGGRPVPLTADSGAPQRRPLWSPDGTQILFETEANLFVMPALGGAPHLVAHEACCAAWSPDGQQIAYARAPRPVAGISEIPERPESIYAMPSRGGPIHFVGLVVDPHSLAWSPDGRWLALVSGNAVFAAGTAFFGNKGPSSIVLVRARGGEPVSVTDNAALNVSPAWAPDSRHLLFVSDREGARDVYAVRLTGAGMPVGPPTRVTTGLNAHSISISTAGTRLAYAVYTSRANIWTIQIPTDGPVSVDRATAVTTGSQTIEQLTVSPDGRWLYFDSDRSGNAHIYRMPLRGGEPEQLTPNPADAFSPSVSPDGRWVAFHSLRFGTRDIFVMSADGGDAERLTDDPGEERNPNWSPDGRSLSYSLAGTDTRDGLYVISRDPDGHWGAPRQLWNRQSCCASWSPDGRTLVSASNNGIWAIPAAGGVPRLAYQLPDSSLRPGLARWSPDGGAIYVKASDREGRASFWALPATGGRPRLLVRFDDPQKPSYRYGWATDGRRLYFTINDRQSNIFLAELHGLR